jgi:hypothetical protein
MIEVLKQAFDVLNDVWNSRLPLHNVDDIRKAKASLRQAIAELENQEPDVVMHWHSHTWTTINPPPKNSGDVNLYYAPPQRTEVKHDQ